MPQAGILARNVRVRVLTDTSAALLETALQAFLSALKEETFLSVQYQAQAGTFSALVTYTR
jgi:hypothetical protein